MQFTKKLVCKSCLLAAATLMPFSTSWASIESEVGKAVRESVAPSVLPSKPAPDFEVLLEDGTKTSLKKLTESGKGVVLEWYNKDCPYVRKHYDTENIQKLQAKYKEKGVVWLSVISSAEGKQGFLSMAQAKKQKKSGEKSFVSTALLLDPDGKVGQSYAAKTTPQMYVIDQKGTLRYSGAIDSLATADKADVAQAEPWFASALDKVLAGQELTAEEALRKPYGCSVKY